MGETVMERRGNHIGGSIMERKSRVMSIENSFISPVSKNSLSISLFVP